jgi:hypothetical protein
MFMFPAIGLPQKKDTTDGYPADGNKPEEAMCGCREGGDNPVHQIIPCCKCPLKKGTFVYYQLEKIQQ